MDKSVLIGKADFDKLSNDMFWKFTHYNIETSHFCHLRWTGYNDNDWWEKYKGDGIEQCGECKKVFKIDYDTNKVYELLPSDKGVDGGKV